RRRCSSSASRGGTEHFSDECPALLQGQEVRPTPEHGLARRTEALEVPGTRSAVEEYLALFRFRRAGSQGRGTSAGPLPVTGAGFEVFRPASLWDRGCR